ncbi:MAG: FKBP-type peptidyl-prolyl cis-trans isomerase [Halobacteriota archaeon]
MSVKRGDFVRLSYTGRLESGDVFDTTDADVAKENGIFAEGVTYASITIIAGENMVVKGLDEDLMGKKSGYQGTVTVPPDKAFGERVPELVEVVPTRRFEKRPMPGMRVSLDNRTGTVESVVGGRARVDFNSPYAGKTVSYEYKIDKVLRSTAEKIKGLLKYYLNRDFEVTVKEKLATVLVPYELGFNQTVQYYKQLLAEKIMQFTSIVEVDYVEVHKKHEHAKEEEGAQSEEKSEQPELAT